MDDFSPIDRGSVVNSVQFILRNPQNQNHPEKAVDTPDDIVREKPPKKKGNRRKNQIEADESDSDVDLTNVEFLHFNGDISGVLEGVKAKKWKELYQLYKNHSNALGFSTKKSTAHRNKSGKLVGRYFQCNCQGQTQRKISHKKGSSVPTPPPVQVDEVVILSPIEKDQLLNKKKRKRRCNVVRTGCKAQMRVVWDKKEDLYVVASHEIAHNHEMTGLYWNHLKRSERSISAETGKLIEDFIEAGIRPKDGYNMLLKSAGGEELVGCTKKDYQNYVTKLKIERIEGGDAQTLVNKLKKLKQEDPSFYYDISFGEESRLENVLFIDPMMILDFDLFGDMVIFDTTYNTNKYNMICAPIVGINHHWNTVMFGCAFLSQETEDSFAWLLKSFLTAMGGKEPKTIFTDQDLAMESAIKRVFLERVRHRLCLWHIQHNAISHFGNLKSDETFKAIWDHCLMGCTSRDEFELCWNGMMDKYNLREISWFSRLYGLKEKWCPALSQDFFFSAGILSSQRSESTNHAICFESNRTTSLTQFYDIFTNTVQRWRSTEQKKEYESINSKPDPHMYGGIIKHAAEVYTLEIFRFFEHEVKAAFAAPYIYSGYRDSNSMSFQVAHEKNPTRYETVIYKMDSGEVTVECSCNHFSAVGWLCFHCIKALNLNNVNCIPEKYIVKRWTKEVKRKIWDSVYRGKVTASVDLPEQQPWMQYMARKFYDLLMVCHEKSGAKKIIENCYENTALEVNEFLSSSSSKKRSTTIESTTHVDDETIVADPIPPVTKGRPKSVKTSKFDRKKPLDATEFISSHRNKHII